MKSTKNLFKLTAMAGLLSVGGVVQAATVTGTMTNIATVLDACDVVATGVDFGVVVTPILPTGQPGVLPNLAHTGTLTLLGITVPTASTPGIYVACTKNPTSIALVGAHGGSLALPVALGPATGAFSGAMTGTGGSIDYTMTFVGSTVAAPAGLPVGVFVAAYVPVALIPAAQSHTFGGGTYSDPAVVTINY